MGSRWQYRHTLLLIYALAYFSTRIEPLVVSPLIPDITAALGTSAGAIGAAMTGLWAAYALVQLPSGLLAGRFGSRSVIVVALLLGGAGSVLLAMSPSILVFAAVTVLLGSVVGLYYNVGVLSLSDWFDDTGSAIGIHRIGAQAAGLVAPVLAVVVASRYGWRAGLLLGAVFSIPTAVLVIAVVEPTPPSAPDEALLAQLRAGAKADFESRPAIFIATLIAGIGEFVAVANVTFLPAFLIAFHGVDQLVAGTLFSVYFVVVSATHPLAGWLTDRYAPDLVVGGALVIGVLSHALLVTVSSTLAVYGLVAVTGLTMAYNIPLQSKVIGLLGESTQGKGFGVFRTLYVLLGSLGGVVIGSVSDVGGWAAAYGFLSALLLLGLVVVLGSAVAVPGRATPE